MADNRSFDRWLGTVDHIVMQQGGVTTRELPALRLRGPLTRVSRQRRSANRNSAYRWICGCLWHSTRTLQRIDRASTVPAPDGQPIDSAVPTAAAWQRKAPVRTLPGLLTAVHGAAPYPAPTATRSLVTLVLPWFALRAIVTTVTRNHIGVRHAPHPFKQS